MSREKFFQLIESNIRMIDKLSERLKKELIETSAYPRAQTLLLIRLHLGGRAKLKDIARREMLTTSNLCATFRKLERDGLILRTIDEKDRRNTWYSITPRGEKVVRKVLEVFRNGIEQMFKTIKPKDEVAITKALETINYVLTKMELNNA